MKQNHFLAFLGMYDYNGKSVIVDKQSLLPERYDNVNYMLCRNFRTGETESFFSNKNGHNEIEEILKNQNQNTKIFIYPEGEIFLLGDFIKIYRYYQDMVKLGIEPTIDDILNEINEICFEKRINKRKILRKRI